MTSIVLMAVAGALIGIATPPLWKRPEWWACESAVVLAFVAGVLAK